MSCLTICQNAIRQCGFAVPNSIVGNTNEAAVRLLALLNTSGKLLARKQWQALQKEHTFSTVASTASYALPSDYAWYVNDTTWDRTNYWRLRNSMSPQQWQEYKSGVNASTPRSRFRIKGSLIYIDPTPSSVSSMVIEYISNSWVTDGSNFFTAFTSDSQTSLIDEMLLELELIWRFKDSEGLAYAEAKNTAEEQIQLSLAHDTPSNSVNLAGQNGTWPPLPTVPVTGYA